MISPYKELDTPSLLVDWDIAQDNIAMMQKKADALGLKLRPHIIDPPMPYFARLQMEAGAVGIACAKIGEAEVVAQHG
jgi:D-serine deaminase-like pyridoxal phosphate-dependent protein